jgi:hypothetical protein
MVLQPLRYIILVLVWILRNCDFSPRNVHVLPSGVAGRM